VPSTPRSQVAPRVWAVSEYYHPNFSGAAIQAHRILTRLARQGLGVTVLTIADQAASSLVGQTRELDGVRVTYLRVIRLRCWARWSRWPRLEGWALPINKFIRDATFHLALARHVIWQMQRGDILQWYVVGDCAWPVFQLARWLGRRNVIQISLIGADDPGSFRAQLFGVSTALKRRCFDVADRVIGLSRALTSSCEQAGVLPARIIRIPNGVDLDLFPPRGIDRDALCARLGLPSEHRHIVFVGSAIYRKGIDVAIRAYIRFAQAWPHVDLLIVGEMDFSDRTRHPLERQALVSQLRQELEESNLTARVHWLGLRDQVAEFLRIADVFLFPTRREGLPNAVAEAMACGLPIIASRLPGITTDLVDNEQQGQLIEGFDPASYASALDAIFRDPEHARGWGQAARLRIEHEFSLPRVVAQYIELYGTLNDAVTRAQEDSDHRPVRGSR